MDIYRRVVFTAMFANVVLPVYTYETTVRLETMMDGDDIVIKCLLPNDVYTGTYKLNWMFRRNHGIITTCRPNGNILCLPPSHESTKWINTHKFDGISGGAKLRIIDFKNRTEDEEFACRFYNGSEFSTEISFSVKSSYKIVQAGEEDKSKSGLQGESTTSTTSDIFTSQAPDIETTQYTNEAVDNVRANNIIPLIILGVLLVISVSINIAAFVHWRYKLRNTGKSNRNSDDSEAHRLLADGGQIGNSSKGNSNRNTDGPAAHRNSNTLAKDSEAHDLVKESGQHVDEDNETNDSKPITGHVKRTREKFEEVKAKEKNRSEYQQHDSSEPYKSFDLQPNDTQPGGERMNEDKMVVSEKSTNEGNSNTLAKDPEAQDLVKESEQHADEDNETNNCKPTTDCVKRTKEKFEGGTRTDNNRSEYQQRDSSEPNKSYDLQPNAKTKPKDTQPIDERMNEDKVVVNEMPTNEATSLTTQKILTSSSSSAVIMTPQGKKISPSRSAEKPDLPPKPLRPSTSGEKTPTPQEKSSSPSSSGNPLNNGNTDTDRSKSDQQTKDIENENAKDKSSTKKDNYNEQGTDSTVNEDTNTDDTQDYNGDTNNVGIDHDDKNEQPQCDNNLLETQKQEEPMEEDDNNSTTPLIKH